MREAAKPRTLRCCSASTRARPRVSVPARVAHTSMMLVRALAVTLDQAGHASTSFLSEAGLSGHRLDDLHARLHIDDYRRAVRAALRVSDDPALGLHMAERISMGSFDVVGHLAEHSSCLREALHAAAHYGRLLSEPNKLALREHADTAVLQLTIPDACSAEARLSAEFSTMGLLRLVRCFVGDGAQPRGVYFVFPTPEHRAEYTRAFAGVEHFSHAFTGIELERAWLDCRPPYHSSELRSYLQARADFLLARLDLEAPTSERIRCWLELNASAARPTLEAIARGLGLSPRSLRRRLRAERVQLSALIEQARAQHATRLLERPHRSIQETAYALGFHDPSAFSRAFKRWTGRPPSAVRAQR